MKKTFSGKDDGGEGRRDETKKKKRDAEGVTEKKKDRDKTAKRAKAKDLQPLWFGHPQEVDSGNDSSSSMGIIPAGKVAGEKADEEERGRSAKKLKRKAGKRARKASASTRNKKQADRGPFGVGHLGEGKLDSKSSDDDEDSGSDFRAGPSTKLRQLQLQEYSEQHPGRLASRHVPTAADDARDPGSAGGAHARKDRAKPDPSHSDIVLPHGADPSISGKDELEDKSRTKDSVQSTGPAGQRQPGISRRHSKSLELYTCPTRHGAVRNTWS